MNAAWDFNFAIYRYEALSIYVIFKVLVVFRAGSKIGLLLQLGV